MYRLHPLIWLLAPAMTVLHGQGKGHFELTPDMQAADSISVYDFAGYYCDSTKRLDFEELREMEDRFVPIEAYGRKFDNRYLHWLFFRIDNRGSADTLRRVFHAHNPYRTYLFQVDSRGVSRKAAGTVNRRVKDFPGWYSFIDIEVLPQEEARFFLKIDDRVTIQKREASSYQMAVFSPAGARAYLEGLVLDRLDIKISLAVFLGILLFMVLFTGFMYIQNKERIYLYYALYVGSLFLFYMVRRSYEFHTPFSYITAWWHYVYPGLSLLMIAAYILFIRTFLDATPERHPRLARVLRAGMGLVLGMLVADLALKLALPLHVYFPIFEWSRMALFVAGGWVIFRVYQLRNPLSRYIVGGTLALVGGVLLVLVTDIIRERAGVDLESKFLSYAQLGVLAEILVFALGLGYRARLLREEKMRAELRALKAQMNPHFVFNSLNAIKDLVQKDKPADAAFYLTRFARLFRGILERSEMELVTLEEELEFCRDYLSIEALRFGQEFHFEAGCDSGLEECDIPPLIFQPFLENAVRHGLTHKQGKRWVTLSVSRLDDAIVARIEDNGVGRQGSVQGENPGFGIRLAKDRLARQFPLSEVSISDKINIFGEAEGTVVEISFREKS